MIMKKFNKNMINKHKYVILLAVMTLIGLTKGDLVWAQSDASTDVHSAMTVEANAPARQVEPKPTVKAREIMIDRNANANQTVRVGATTSVRVVKPKDDARTNEIVNKNNIFGSSTRPKPIDRPASTSSTSTRPNKLEVMNTKKDEQGLKNLDYAITKALEIIEKRLLNLNNLSTRLSVVKGQEDKLSTVTTNTEAQISLLNEIKVKIESATTVDEVKLYIKEINDVQAKTNVLIPKGRIISAGQRIISTSDLIGNVVKKINDRIVNDKVEVRDTSKAQSALKGISEKLDKARIEARGAIELVSKINSSDTNDSNLEARKATIMKAEEAVKRGHEYLISAKNDLQTITKLMVETKTVSNTSANGTSSI
jgi:hypothetical protein